MAYTEGLNKEQVKSDGTEVVEEESVSGEEDGWKRTTVLDGQSSSFISI